MIMVEQAAGEAMRHLVSNARVGVVLLAAVVGPMPRAYAGTTPPIPPSVLLLNAESAPPGAPAFMAPALNVAPSDLGEPSEPMPMPPAGATPAAWQFHPARVLAVAAGAVAGVLATDVLLATNLVYVAGGMAGGYLVDVWYGGRQIEVKAVPK